MGTKPLTQTTGRRKAAIARARLRPGTGKVTVNGRAFEVYFPSEVQRAEAIEALRVVEAESSYDVDADIEAPVVDAHDVTARQREDDLDARSLQGLCDEPAAVRRG